ncbi:hypothetical protein DACRYDRAFT_108741 [Dacryopinax primogenitus]|uniref:Uncharacterized protein n=1 Tax=Dacryopinax primogenitus (strain DJM 731) TaxID=1858805 RepID=M5FWC3_DACPD|nr:uncharacterized protein DACRYDRAFT_108741 [Dacryopinax primogenitus]EJU00674.1 hypothetical protein DACRYDRAFT_108741 [Dacryopinax primogenitus]
MTPAVSEYNGRICAFPEEEPLHLPSSYEDPAVRRQLGLEHLSATELELRKGQALDLLQKLREAVRRRRVMQAMKRTNVRHQGPQTMAARTLIRQKDEIDLLTNRYRRCYKSMLILGLPEDHKQYRNLEESDVYGVALTQLQEDLGTGRQRLPWYFHLGAEFAAADQKSSSSNEESLDEAVSRVTWWRTKAKADRWAEEEELTREEMRRTLKSYTFWRDIWCQKAASVGQSTQIERGRAAYAYKQGSVFARLYDEGISLCATGHERARSNVLTLARDLTTVKSLAQTQQVSQNAASLRPHSPFIQPHNRKLRSSQTRFPCMLTMDNVSISATYSSSTSDLGGGTDAVNKYEDVAYEAYMQGRQAYIDHFFPPNYASHSSSNALSAAIPFSTMAPTTAIPNVEFQPSPIVINNNCTTNIIHSNNITYRNNNNSHHNNRSRNVHEEANTINGATDFVALFKKFFSAVTCGYLFPLAW